MNSPLLRASPLEIAGLVGALKKQSEALGYRTGAAVSFEMDDLPPNDAVEPGTQLAIFRVAQEALANIGRHARARVVRVRLSGAADALCLSVHDDGGGFESSAASGGMGLSNMKARAAEVGGELHLASAPGVGTTVTFTVPLRRTSFEDLQLYRRRAIMRMIGVLREGAAGYVRKDADPEILLSAVRAVARGHTYLDPSVSPQVLAVAAAPGDLTDREMQVLRQLALGRTNKEIATALALGEETVKTHVGNVLSKLQVENRSQAVVQALKRGLVSLEDSC